MKDDPGKASLMSFAAESVRDREAASSPNAKAAATSSSSTVSAGSSTKKKKVRVVTPRPTLGAVGTLGHKVDEAVAGADPDQQELQHQRQEQQEQEQAKNPSVLVESRLEIT